MINLTQVSLRQAREDCGISGSGGLKNIQEFKDRLGAANGTPVGDYTLKDLAGTVACKSTNATLGNFNNNYNPGSGCRPNWCEANAYSVNNKLRSVITREGTNLAVECAGNGAYMGYSGHSFVGRVPAGSALYSVSFDIRRVKNGVESAAYELIGWPSGYFSGTPVYYDQLIGQSVSGTKNYTINGSATPYITITMQNISDSVYINYTSTSKCLMKRV